MVRLDQDEEQIEILSLDDNDATRALYGHHNSHLKIIEKRIGISVDSRGGEVIVKGRPAKVKTALAVLNQLYALAGKQKLNEADVENAISVLSSNPETDLLSLFSEKIILTTTRKVRIVPKSPAQRYYVDAIRQNDMVFAIGPAGTGKTYLAMAMGVAALLRKEYRRIILTRPAVEAGERLGFLPGDLVEKVNPYLRPLYDALYDMVDVEKAQYWMANGIVEVAPIAFMRGRTLNDSFIILDEAQNTTPEQMKMFLTRMGFGSKALINGDVTQIDLPGSTSSGLVHAARLLKGIEGIEVCRFSEKDVVRHPIVQRIVRAYETESEGGNGDAK